MWVSKNSLLDWVKNSQLIDGEVSLCTYTESFICEFLFMSVVILRACLHGGGRPQVGEVTRLGEVKK